MNGNGKENSRACNAVVLHPQDGAQIPLVKADKERPYEFPCIDIVSFAAPRKISSLDESGKEKYLHQPVCETGCGNQIRSKQCPLMFYDLPPQAEIIFPPFTKRTGAK